MGLLKYWGGFAETPHAHSKVQLSHMTDCLLPAYKGMVEKNTELEQQVTDLLSELERVTAEALLPRQAFVAAASQKKKTNPKTKQCKGYKGSEATGLCPYV